MTREECAARAQRALWPIVGILQGVEDTMDALIESMPESPEELLGPLSPAADLMLEVEGALYFTLNDDLRPMLDRLKRLAVLTHADVARDQETARLRMVN